MPKKTLCSRIGRCRGGKPVDLPHKFDAESLKTFLKSFAESEIIDLFCMVEALLFRYRELSDELRELETIQDLSDYFWHPAIRKTLDPELKQLGLNVSPDFVRHGQKLLLL